MPEIEPIKEDVLGDKVEHIFKVKMTPDIIFEALQVLSHAHTEKHLVRPKYIVTDMDSYYFIRTSLIQWDIWSVRPQVPPENVKIMGMELLEQKDFITLTKEEIEKTAKEILRLKIEEMTKTMGASIHPIKMDEKGVIEDFEFKHLSVIYDPHKYPNVDDIKRERIIKKPDKKKRRKKK